MNSKVCTKHKASFLLICLLVVEFALMISDYKVISNKASVFITVVVLACFVCVGVFSKLQKLEKLFVLSALVYCIYYILSSFSSGLPFSKTIEDLLYFAIELTPFAFYLYLRKKASRSNKLFIVICFFLIWDFFCIVSLFYFAKDPDLARKMAASRYEYYSLAIGGGYPMAYGSAVLSVFLFEALLKRIIPRRLILPTIFEIGLMLILVINTHSFIVLFAQIFGFLLCFFLSRLSKKTLSIVFPALIALLVLVALFGEPLLSIMIAHIDNAFIKNRLSEIYQFIYFNNADYHISARITVYLDSLNSFQQHPLFGIGNSSGDHSTIIDSLAQFGILGSIPFFYLCFYPFFKNRRSGQSSFYLAPYVIMLFLNPVFSCFHLMSVVFLFVPLLQDLLTGETK